MTKNQLQRELDALQDKLLFLSSITPKHLNWEERYKRSKEKGRTIPIFSHGKRTGSVVL